MASAKPVIPAGGESITMSSNGTLNVPDRPSFPSSRATAPVLTSGAPRCACSTRRWKKNSAGKKKIAWAEVYAGEKAKNLCGTWLPDETIEAFKTYLVGIKGPLTTPIGGGIRSLNVAIRQILDLYVCCGRLRYFAGVPRRSSAPKK